MQNIKENTKAKSIFISMLSVIFVTGNIATSNPQFRKGFLGYNKNKNGSLLFNHRILCSAYLYWL